MILCGCILHNSFTICLGFTLYHQLTSQHVECIILAPTTMLEQRSKKRIKTDKRDAEIIAKCLAQHNYSPVHIQTATDEQIKEFLRMRDDHKLALKKIKQQILAFCLRHNYRYDGNSHWTAAHLCWLKSLQPEALISLYYPTNRRKSRFLWKQTNGFNIPLNFDFILHSESMQ